MKKPIKRVVIILTITIVILINSLTLSTIKTFAIPFNSTIDQIENQYIPARMHPYEYVEEMLHSRFEKEQAQQQAKERAKEIEEKRKEEERKKRELVLSEIEWYHSNMGIRIVPVFNASGVLAYGDPIGYITVKYYNVYDKESFNKSDDYALFRDIMMVLEETQETFKKGTFPIPAEAMLAQARTEGGAGRDGKYAITNNLFGIAVAAESEWNGLVCGKVNDTNYIFINYEEATKAGATNKYKAYHNIEESITDYINIITNGDRYKDLLPIINGNPEKYLRGLGIKGYCGDLWESDVNRWIQIINTYNLREFVQNNNFYCIINQ